MVRLDIRPRQPLIGPSNVPLQTCNGCDPIPMLPAHTDVATQDPGPARGLDDGEQARSGDRPATPMPARIFA